MKNLKHNQRGGAIKTIIFVVAALVLLKYLYQFDVIGDLSQGKFKYVLDKFYAFGQAGWSKWNYILVKVWEFAKSLFWNILNTIK
jgi:hypothetical protein